MKIYLVGGAVRDKLLGLPIHERDWVVVDASPSDMLALGYRQVGKDFPVFLHPKTNEEYALARTERKINPGYQGFAFDTSKAVTLEDDLVRRDLTINAMAETLDGQLIDPYHGATDLEQKLLKHVSPAFVEDPVRILRVGRFLARYYHLGFRVAPETIALMKTMVQSGEVNALVAERVWKELERALGEPNPEQFFQVLADCDSLSRLFPELVLQGRGLAALKIAAQQQAAIPIRFAVLWHDLPNPAQSIAALCKRYRVPSDYQDLAKLAAIYYETFLNARALSSETLLDLCYATDVFRREQRFQQLLLACEVIAIANNTSFNREWFTACTQTVKAAPIQPLIAQGLQGPELAQQIKQKRREAIAAWLKTQQIPPRS